MTDPRSVRLRGLRRAGGRAVVLSVDVADPLGGPPLEVLLSRDEARLAAQLLREMTGGRRRRPGVPRPERPENLAGRVRRHLSGLFGSRTIEAVAPRAPP